jgi:hypothetical protein
VSLRDGRAHQLGQPRGAGEGLAGPLADDRVGDPGGEALLAVLLEHARQRLAVVAVDDLGGGGAARGVHAHVQRRVLRVGEAAVGLVELQRADPEVEQHAVHAVQAEAASTAGSSSYTACTSVVRPAYGARPLAAAAQRLGVAVQADQPAVRRGLQQRLGVTAHPERAVHDHGAGLGEGRCHQPHAPLSRTGTCAGSGALMSGQRGQGPPGRRW